MKYLIQNISPFTRFVRSNVILASLLMIVSVEASARQPASIPEPSMLSLLGASLVIGIIAHRLKGPKK
jgi:hypothetical protein